MVWTTWWCSKLQLDVPPADLTEWKQVVSRIATRSKTCTIALVGKYVKLHDAYLSVMESPVPRRV